MWIAQLRGSGSLEKIKLVSLILRICISGYMEYNFMLHSVTFMCSVKSWMFLIIKFCILFFFKQAKNPPPVEISTRT